jgi:hypothetical protein
MRYEPPVPATVRGEWAADETRYPCLLAGTWNGWGMPLFDRATAELVVADQEKLAEGLADDLPTKLEWVGDGIRVMQDEEEPWLIAPGEDGRYDLSLGWCWEYELSGPDPDQPTPAQLQAYERLRDSVMCPSYTRESGEGGHTFDVQADLGRRDDAYPGTTVIETLCRVRVDADGVVRVLACDHGNEEK